MPVTTMPTLNDRRPFLLLLSALVVAVDRISKLWITRAVPMGHAIPVIPGVFRITHVMNVGAAFSLFADSGSTAHVRWALAAFSGLAVLAILIAILKLGRTLTLTAVSLALILGGAIGNLYDRVLNGQVLDFLEVHIVHYHWPDFNLADSAIVIGGILLVIASLRSPRAESSAASQAALASR